MVTFGATGSYPPSPFTHATATSMAVPYPTGIVAGAPMILVALNSETLTFTTPSGWTLKQSNSNVASESDLSMYVWTTQAVGTESGSLTVSGSGTAGDLVGAIAIYTGADPTTPITTTAVTTTPSGTTSKTSPASLTALSPAPGTSDLVVRLYGYSQDTKATGESLTNPGGTWTTRLNLVTASTSSFQTGLVIADKVDGTDSQTITAAKEVGVFMVVDIEIKNAATSTYAQPVNRARLIRASHW